MSEQTKTGRLPQPLPPGRSTALTSRRRAPQCGLKISGSISPPASLHRGEDERYYRKWLGGSGIITEVLLRELPAGVDALGPENKLVFALSPITGTSVYATGRNGVGAKSPPAEASPPSGEYWAPS
jgi:hypothetical protein